MNKRFKVLCKLMISSVKVFSKIKHNLFFTKQSFIILTKV